MPDTTKSRRKGTSQVRQSSLLRPKPDEQIVWSDVYKELTDYFESDEPKAKNALEKLERFGCDKRAVLQYIYLFCGGDPQHMALLRQGYKFKDQEKRMLQTVEMVRALILRMESARKFLAGSDIFIDFTPDTLELKRYADFLEHIAKEYVHLLGSNRITGRDGHLAYLCDLIRITTGKPHYAEIADLVNGTQHFYAPELKKTATSESIRLRIRTHQRILASTRLNRTRRGSSKA